MFFSPLEQYLARMDWMRVVPVRYSALPYESYADEALSDPYLELKAELERIEVLFK